jgi:phosphomannomutase
MAISDIKIVDVDGTELPPPDEELIEEELEDELELDGLELKDRVVAYASPEKLPEIV